MLDKKRNGQYVKDPVGWNDEKGAVMEKIILFKAVKVISRFSFQTVDIEFFFFVEATFYPYGEQGILYIIIIIHKL